MSCTADIAVVVTSFERPSSLRRSLLSLSLQASHEHLAEVIVADDGSRDETWQVVDAFARRSGMPITFTTHEHAGFQLARSRNEAALCSTAPYLAFLDGDCVVPHNFLTTHVKLRQKRVALCGESLRLSQSESVHVTDEAIRKDELFALAGNVELKRLVSKARRDRLYSFFRVPMRPRLTGNHFSLWREDFDRVGGFDNGFRGWGLEDCDLQRRLQRVGVRCKTVLPKTVGFHLWHPPVESFVRKAKNTPNEARYRQPIRPDGRAHSGLEDVAQLPYSVWKWRAGNLVEGPRLADAVAG